MIVDESDCDRTSDEDATARLEDESGYDLDRWSGLLDCEMDEQADEAQEKACRAKRRRYAEDSMAHLRRELQEEAAEILGPRVGRLAAALPALNRLAFASAETLTRLRHPVRAPRMLLAALGTPQDPWNDDNVVWPGDNAEQVQKCLDYLAEMASSSALEDLVILDLDGTRDDLPPIRAGRLRRLRLGENDTRQGGLVDSAGRLFVEPAAHLIELEVHFSSMYDPVHLCGPPGSPSLLPVLEMLSISTLDSDHYTIEALEGVIAALPATLRTFALRVNCGVQWSGAATRRRDGVALFKALTSTLANAHSVPALVCLRLDFNLDRGGRNDDRAGWLGDPAFVKLEAAALERGVAFTFGGAD